MNHFRISILSFITLSIASNIQASEWGDSGSTKNARNLSISISLVFCVDRKEPRKLSQIFAHIFGTWMRTALCWEESNELQLKHLKS